MEVETENLVRTFGIETETKTESKVLFSRLQRLWSSLLAHLLATVHSTRDSSRPKIVQRVHREGLEHEYEQHEHCGAVLNVVVQLASDAAEPQKPYDFQGTEQTADALLHAGHTQADHRARSKPFP